MRHNNFKFTIKFIIPDSTPREVLEQYIKYCCGQLPQPCIGLEEVVVTFLRKNTYIAYLVLQTKDYGLPQVGIDLVAAWIEHLYTHCEGFSVDAVMVHPKADPPANGAVVRWDYINDCPIVKVID